MRYFYFLIVLFHFLYLVTLEETTISKQSSTTEKYKEDILEEFDLSQSYCFRFTWIGPEFDNSSEFNGTCVNLIEEKRAKGVPCTPPLVITYDGTPPDMEYLWQNYKTRVLCRRANGLVCGKYSYYFNNKVQNITYMCTKASTEGIALTDGCYKSRANTHEVEACVCESVKGYKPCNSATPIGNLSFCLILLMLFCNIIYAYH